MTVALIGSRRGTIVAIVLAVIGALLPWFIYPVLAIDIVAYALFAVAFDLLLGFTGLLSFGHAMFWGGAGYVATILLAKAGAPFPVAVAAALVYAALSAVVVGVIAIRRQGIYFAMITLALAQLQYFVAFQLGDWTGGENGVQVSSRGTLFGLGLDDDKSFYYAVLVVAALGVWFWARCARTSSVRSRSAFGSTATSSSRSCSPVRWQAWPACSSRWATGSRVSTASIGTPAAKSSS
jgi:ABC-type branched-subunit amino acid transport system permease subunit